MARHRVTWIKLSGGQAHEHITHIGFANLVKWNTQEGVNFLGVRGNSLYVMDGRCMVEVIVVEEGEPPYLRTRADGRWTDNLLGLPQR